MLSEEKHTLKKHISREIEILRKDIGALKKSAQPVSLDDPIGRITRMDAINNKSISEASLRNAENSLAQLQHALKMIDDPDFGLCAECGEPIPFKRLMIMPGSTLCVGCAGQKR